MSPTQSNYPRCLHSFSLIFCTLSVRSFYRHNLKLRSLRMRAIVYHLLEISVENSDFSSKEIRSSIYTSIIRPTSTIFSLINFIDDCILAQIYEPFLQLTSSLFPQRSRLIGRQSTNSSAYCLVLDGYRTKFKFKSV